MTDMLREAPLGQIIRWVTKNRLLPYPEELPDFELPATYNAVLNSSGAPPKVPIAARKESKEKIRQPSNASSEEGVTPDTIDLEKSETQQPNPYDNAVDAMSLSRTKSRLETTPYSEERLEIEAELALERTKSAPIMPTKTPDGNVLVEWVVEFHSFRDQ